MARQAGANANGVAGEAPALYDVSNISNGDVTTIVPIAVLAIGLVLALVLRSLVAPIYLILSVVLSYLASLGISVLVFMTIGGQQGLVFLLPFLMFIFLLALGEDYNILVMTRIREEARTGQAGRAAAGGGPGGRRHRPDGHLCGPGAGRELRRPGGRRRLRAGQRADPGDRLRAGGRDPHRHLRGAHRPRALDRRAAGPLELVAIGAGPGDGDTSKASHRAGAPDRRVDGGRVGGEAADGSAADGSAADGSAAETVQAMDAQSPADGQAGTRDTPDRR